MARVHPGRKVLFTAALPVYNEAGVLRDLHGQLTRACSQADALYEILFVDDGSEDESPAILRDIAERDPHVTVARLSRNFGHPAALAAAVDLAAGTTLILMDADLQDDPSAITELLRLQREEAADVVYVVRSGRMEGASLRLLFSAFHWLIARASTYEIPRDAGSFGLVGPRALAELRRLTERLRYFPGLRAFIGFKQVPLSLPRHSRYDRRSRVGLGGLFGLAAQAFFSQSRAPAALFYALSAMSMVMSGGLMSYAVVAKALGVAVVSWTSTVTSIAFFSSVVILGQAFICEYLARIYEEVRGRPVYVLDYLHRSKSVVDGDGTADAS